MGPDAIRIEPREPDLYNEFWPIPELTISNTDYGRYETTTGMTQTITADAETYGTYNLTWDRSDLDDLLKKIHEAYGELVLGRSENELDDLDAPDSVTDVLLG